MHDETDIIETLRRGERASAIAMAREAAEAKPDDPQAQRILALALAMHGRPDEAHRALDRALALAPNDASLHYQRAVLLVSENRSADAAAELDRSVAANPNELRAYVVQAQLALGRGDLDEADRQARLAARIDPNHPWLLTVQGMVLLHREQLPEAHRLIARAAQLAPDDIQTRYALGLSFLAQGHLAFAEQAFRRVLELNPKAVSIRHMLADVIRRQERHAEAAGVIEGGTAHGELPPDLLRYAGELWLVAREHERALPLLRRAASARPDDRVTLDALIEALRRTGDAAQARHVLEEAIAAAPHVEGLWSARLSFEPRDGDVAGVAARWQAAIPTSVHPLHVSMWDAIQKGDRAASRELAERIVQIEPGHAAAQAEIVEQLYGADPEAAVRHIQSLLPQIGETENLRMVLGWLGRAQDRAGQYADAVETWTRLHANPGPQAQPLPASSGDAVAHPPATERPGAQPRPVFLYGPPGSGAERVVSTLLHNFPGRVLTDRNGPRPPQDPLQMPQTAARLAAGEFEGTLVASAWTASLAARSADAVSAPVDWLMWWDNALVRVLREGVPEALLLLVLSDPRDMLVDWLQRDAFVRYDSGTPTDMARWLADVLEQLAVLVEGNFVAHRLLRIGEIAGDPAALASTLGEALGVQLAPAPTLGAGRFPAGHWRQYAEALAEPFALLAPVARRLGYPET